jgi:hypothetical protein
MVPDYWSWNRLLQSISGNNPTTKESLRTSIIKACRGVGFDESRKTIAGFRGRLEEYVASEGDEVRTK